jgi:hypothetical protein
MSHVDHRLVWQAAEKDPYTSLPPIARKEWSTGVLDYWSDGVRISPPILRYSNAPPHRAVYPVVRIARLIDKRVLRGFNFRC